MLLRRTTVISSLFWYAKLFIIKNKGAHTQEQANKLKVMRKYVGGAMRKQIIKIVFIRHLSRDMHHPNRFTGINFYLAPTL